MKTPLIIFTLLSAWLCMGKCMPDGLMSQEELLEQDYKQELHHLLEELEDVEETAMEQLMLQPPPEENTEERTYSNQPDQPLNVECNKTNGEGITKVHGQYSQTHHDRTFTITCEKVASTPGEDCKWYSNINHYKQFIAFICPVDFYMAGIKSVHSNTHEDRKWEVECCRSKNYRTNKGCEWTGVNNGITPTNDGTFLLSEFTLPVTRLTGKNGCVKSVLTGIASTFHYHVDGAYQDRSWKIQQCLLD